MKALRWFPGILGLAVLVLMLLPASVWKAPSADASYSGFDRTLMYATGGGGGRVTVTPARVDMRSTPGSKPSINLATALVPDVTAGVTVDIVSNSGAGEPLRIGVWSPWSASGYFIVFGPAPANEISGELLDRGGLGSTLSNGKVVFSQVVGRYTVDTPYSLSFAISRSEGEIVASITPLGGDAIGTRITRDTGHLFDQIQLSLTASSTGGPGAARVLLTKFTLIAPHQRWWAVKVDDGTERAIVLVLAALCAGLLVVRIAVGSRTWRFRLPRPRLVVGRSVVVIAIAVAVYLTGNVLLFGVGSHPFDFQYEEMYTYISWTRGPAELYFLPNVISLAGIWGGVPFIEGSFPYGPVFAYLYGGLGWIMGAVLTAGAGFGIGNGHERIVDLLKAVNVLFGLADAWLIFAICRRIGVSLGWSYAATALWLFNPAVWFSMSVWGQTHVISLFFVLLVVLAIEHNRPLIGWLALAAAVMTRPQMIVFGLLLAIVLLRRFGLAANARALSWTLISVFLLLLPLTLAIGPTLPVDVMLHNFVIQQAGGNASGLTTVSQDAYSIWPLVTYVVSGTTGIQRAFTPSSTDVIGSLTYQRLGLILTLLALIAVGAALAFRRRDRLENGGYLPLVALGMCSFLMLLTGVVATHFLLALPLLLLCRRWMGSATYLFVVAVWTVSTIVPMYGDMGVAISAKEYPALAGSALTSAMIALYHWDRFITVSIVANLCGLVLLGWLIFRKTPVDRGIGTGAPAST